MDDSGVLATVTNPEDMRYPDTYYLPLQPYRHVTHRITANITKLPEWACNRATRVGVNLRKGEGSSCCFRLALPKPGVKIFVKTNVHQTFEQLQTTFVGEGDLLFSSKILVDPANALSFCRFSHPGHCSSVGLGANHSRPALVQEEVFSLLLYVALMPQAITNRYETREGKSSKCTNSSLDNFDVPLAIQCALFSQTTRS